MFLLAFPGTKEWLKVNLPHASRSLSRGLKTISQAPGDRDDSQLDQKSWIQDHVYVHTYMGRFITDGPHVAKL